MYQSRIVTKARAREYIIARSTFVPALRSKCLKWLDNLKAEKLKLDRVNDKMYNTAMRLHGLKK